MISDVAAILFDMDGVLVNSLHAWLAAMNAVLCRYNLPELSEKEFREQYWGHDLFENLHRLGLNDRASHFCVNTFVDHVEDISIFSGAKEVLQQLYQYPKALVTNTPRHCVLKVLDYFDLETYFDVIITSDDVFIGKPNPHMILCACNRLGVNSKNVIFVGDTESDVKAGIAAGCIVVGIGIKADTTISSIENLPYLLTEQA